ncbi:hypothetical protein MUK42_07805 [Musa troglodytarum]|uniref:4-hydroxy-4-methyl-2-oxoglutarate aldolase n=1 Tax=Musa troglodytarum TaxID=320322 RepID=A0A9E7KJT1_9LILI|nr:hypothetical protein MUK42_07805 [Musa troglodytarum]
MTTATFRSATGRSSIGGSAAARSARDTGSSGGGGPPRRSRSLSRLSPSQPEAEDFPTPPGRFVNRARGCVFPEISLDDVVDEFFRARAESEEEEDSEPSDARSRRGSSVTSYPIKTESSGRRGRSVTRPPHCQTAPPKGVSNSVLRRRRSVSVARHRCSDSENDMDSLSSSTQVKSWISDSGILQQPSSHRPVNNVDVLKRTTSHKDFFHSHDSYSSHSSSLTDVEAGDFHSRKHGVEKTIQAVYAQEKSEKRKQDLLAELTMEEERGQELSKIVKELLPSPKISAVPERQSQSRRRSKDRTRLSKRLTEEAEKYFEDFLFNVEDTDLSSFDEERSDASSIVRDPGLRNSVAGTCETVLQAAPLPADGDGVVLPWLGWETSVGPSSPCKSKFLLIYHASSIVREAGAGFGNCDQIASGFGSRSFDGNDSSSVVSSDPSGSKFGAEAHQGNSCNGRTTSSSFDMDECLDLKQGEDILCERLRQRRRIESGGMILCGRFSTYGSQWYATSGVGQRVGIDCITLVSLSSFSGNHQVDWIDRVHHMRGKVLLPGPPRQTRIRGSPYALETDGNSWPGRIESTAVVFGQSNAHPLAGYLSWDPLDGMRLRRLYRDGASVRVRPNSVSRFKGSNFLPPTMLTISHPSSDRDTAVPALRRIPLRPPPIRQHLMGSLATAELCDANASLLAKGELRVLQPMFQTYGQCRAFCGPIVTLKVFEDNVLVREVLEAPGDGRVLVVDGGGSTRCALVGGNLGQLAQNMGWAGIVVNGCIRDAYEINGCDIGVRALGCHPLKSNKKGLGEKHVTVNIGGTIIHDGEWLYADSDGILVSAIELSL